MFSSSQTNVFPVRFLVGLLLYRMVIPWVTTVWQLLLPMTWCTSILLPIVPPVFARNVRALAQSQLHSLWLRCFSVLLWLFCLFSAETLALTVACSRPVQWFCPYPLCCLWSLPWALFTTSVLIVWTPLAVSSMRWALVLLLFWSHCCCLCLCSSTTFLSPVVERPAHLALPRILLWLPMCKHLVLLHLKSCTEWYASCNLLLLFCFCYITSLCYSSCDKVTTVCCL